MHFISYSIFKKKKEKSNNETSDNKIVKTEEIIPVISKLIKNESRKLLTVRFYNF